MLSLENNDRPVGGLQPEKANPVGGLQPEKANQIQLVVNRPETDEVTIDLGRVFHNMKLRARLFSWVLVFCILLGVSVPLLMYQFQKPALTVSSVVSLRYEVANPAYVSAKARNDTEAMKRLAKTIPLSGLLTPDGAALDLSMVTSSPVLQAALADLVLSEPISIENVRNNMNVTRVLTQESSRTKEVLSGLADAKNVEAYTRLEETELTYQPRFVVSLTNGFGDADSNAKKYLKDEELKLLLNRVLDAYNDMLVKQYADVRLPEDKVSVIDMETQDLPEVLDSLSAALDDLYDYCDGQSDSVKAYRSWQTGLTLNEWMESIRTVQDVSVDYLNAFIYAKGLMRDKDSVRLTFRYRIRTLQSDLDKVNEEIAANTELLKSYKNDEVYVNMQESDGARSTQMTTEYYNQLIIRQQRAYQQAAQLRTEIAETQNKLDRLDSYAKVAEISEAEADLENAVTAVNDLYTGIRTHMTELFSSSLFTTYSDHSAPQGKLPSFLAASAKKMIIGGAVGAVLALGLWFLAALAPEFRRNRKDEDAPKAGAAGKEAARA